ncbi:MAG: prepilin peptidase [Chloroflexi bacterium]|nr:prepilin peptidase [Chloroflexota bacterium]
MLGVLAFAIGASIGSFLNVVADRLPSGRSLISPRSYCEACNRPLTSLDLVPVLSFLGLRGRCRHCSAAIPARVVAVEAATGVLFVVAYVRYGLGFDFVVVCAALSLLLVVGLIDLERGLILNRIVYPSIVALLVVAPFWSELGLPRTFFGSEGLSSSLLNSVLAGLGAFLFFMGITLAYPKGMGGGDVKLAGLLGLLLGYPGVLIALWIAVIAGGSVAVALLLTKKKGRKDAIPFGPFLSFGALVVLLGGTDVTSQYYSFVDGLTVG